VGIKFILGLVDEECHNVLKARTMNFSAQYITNGHISYMHIHEIYFIISSLCWNHVVHSKCTYKISISL